MRHAFLAIFVAALVAGCSTAGDVLSESPAIMASSTKPASQVVGCAAPSLLKTWPTTRQISQGSGYVILVSGDAFGGVLAAVDIAPSSSGADVAIKHGAGSKSVLQGIDDQVRACL